MAMSRREPMVAAGLGSVFGSSGMAAAAGTDPAKSLLLSDFGGDDPYMLTGSRWRGFTDRVMGGVSAASFEHTELAGRRCAHMTGRVTRDQGGGFVQLALYFQPPADASAYSGIELLVHGNDERYNLHLRTPDCGWHSQSYRATFFAPARWTTLRLHWSAFAPNELSAPLDTARLTRLGLLGWMREFQADLAVGSVALFA